MLGALWCLFRFTCLFSLWILLFQLLTAVPDLLDGNPAAMLTQLKDSNVWSTALFYGVIIGIICMSQNYGCTPISTRSGAPDVNPTTGNQMASDSLDVAGNAYGAPPKNTRD